MRGWHLSLQQAQRLEHILVAHPNDLSLRTELLGYYFQNYFISPETREARARHIFWIITNRPDAMIAGLPEASFDPHFNLNAYSKAKQLWQEQVAKHPTNADVLGNAADFLLFGNDNTAKELLRRAAVLEPNNPRRLDSLGFFCVLHLQDSEGDAHVKMAQEALGYYEKALILSHGVDISRTILSSAAEAAFEAGDYAKAQTFAIRMLSAGAHRNRKGCGDELHHGNIMLGRLALHVGDVAQAKAYLLKAGEVPTSAVLSSFGPNMELAKELLDIGEEQTVLKYFDLCAKFWKSNQLTEWRSEVEQGFIPDFVGQLNI
jgi:tetratricopeptide (TPR) repeat protein